MGELSTFKAADHRKKGKGSSKAAVKVSKNGEHDIAEQPPLQSGGDGTPNLVLHPGKSRSRERKNKLRKKGKTWKDKSRPCTQLPVGIVIRSFVARPVIGRPSHEII